MCKCCVSTDVCWLTGDQSSDTLVECVHTQAASFRHSVLLKGNSVCDRVDASSVVLFYSSHFLYAPSAKVLFTFTHTHTLMDASESSLGCGWLVG